MLKGIWRYENLLLFAIPGLMLCVIPVSGMEFRLSWQLVSLWLAGAVFVLVLHNPWLRAFWLIALIRTMCTIPPVTMAYISLLTIAIFLLAVEGFSKLDLDQIMEFMCYAAALLLAWMSLQFVGILPSYFARPAGPFNPDAAGMFLAMCLPAVLRKNWIYGLPAMLGGLIVLNTTTAWIAATTALVIWIQPTFHGQTSTAKTLRCISICAALLASYFGARNLEESIRCVRWTAWKHALHAIWQQPWGYGLGSWSDLFPLMSSGSIGTISTENGQRILHDAFVQGHNEYIQTTFECGLPAGILLAAFVVWILRDIIRKRVNRNIAAGLMAMLVGCCGFFTMHVAPTALLGCAWIGLYLQGATHATDMTFQIVGVFKN